MHTWNREVPAGLWQERVWTAANSLNRTGSRCHGSRAREIETFLKNKSCRGNGKDRQALDLCGGACASVCFTQLWHRCIVGMIVSVQFDFMSPRPALDCRCAPFSGEAQCSPLHLGPALASLPHSFCPTVGEDTAIKCLSSLWQLSVQMDIPVLEDTLKVAGLMLCTQSRHGICWSCSCCRLEVPLRTRPYPCLIVFVKFTIQATWERNRLMLAFELTVSQPS